MLMLRWDVHAGIPDPQLEVQILQLDAHGNLIEGGLLDRDHPRTEWKNPVRTDPLTHITAIPPPVTAR